MRSFNKPRRFEKREGDRFRKDDSDRPERREFNRTPRRGSRIESFEVTCDRCGKSCDVPFRPTGNKPVYCRDCFRKSDTSESGERSDNFESRERPNTRFESRGRSNDRFESRIQSKPSFDDLEKINRKLDKIMKALKID